VKYTGGKDYRLQVREKKKHIYLARVKQLQFAADLQKQTLTGIMGLDLQIEVSPAVGGHTSPSSTRHQDPAQLQLASYNFR